MLKPFRTGLLALGLLVSGLPICMPTHMPTYVSAAQTTPSDATDTAAEPQVTAADEDSETDRGWVGVLPLLGAATLMAVGIATTVSFIRRRR